MPAAVLAAATAWILMAFFEPRPADKAASPHPAGQGAD
jgi:hypothetical protein